MKLQLLLLLFRHFKMSCLKTMNCIKYLKIILMRFFDDAKITKVKFDKIYLRKVKITYIIKNSNIFRFKFYFIVILLTSSWIFNFRNETLNFIGKRKVCNRNVSMPPKELSRFLKIKVTEHQGTGLCSKFNDNKENNSGRIKMLNANLMYK